ncbi:hypothetical protein Q0F98_37240 [Paenibacillus amylolyticus]|nr:hypothetical protein Q0F98_37240 [Paenibacillus amylolyticus]
MYLFRELNGGGSYNDWFLRHLIREQAWDQVRKRLTNSDTSFNHGIMSMDISIGDIERHFLLSDPLSKADSGNRSYIRKMALTKERSISLSGSCLLIL